MDPQEGARAFLRYLYEAGEERDAVLAEISARLDRIERYLAPMYAMVEEAYRSSGGSRVAPVVPGPAAVPRGPSPAETIARTVGSAAVKRLAEWLIRRGAM